MRLTIVTAIIFFVSEILILGGCQEKQPEVVELKHYPLDTVDGIITKSGVGLDKNVTTDGNGSIKIIVRQASNILLYETGDIDVEKAKLIYQAKIRTEDVEGKVYLEMWCHFPGKGEFFSRALHAQLSGTNEWSTQETAFILNRGENPDNVKLNIVIEGKGVVWVDDIRLFKGLLN